MRKKKKLKKGVRKFFGFFVLLGIIYLGFEAFNYYYTLNQDITLVYESKGFYYASDLGINVIKSDFDYDEDGIDDYTDILMGAKQYAEYNPKYLSKYYDGGYPPVEEEGVCTDLIWFALQNAGYFLKDMISHDIKLDAEKETNRYDIDIRDDNIDFRRVDNQETFLDTYVESLTTNIYELEEFMPGDIVTFDYGDHIAMISDKRNEEGIPYLIQNRSEEQEEKEEDRILKTDMTITGHYRFTYNEELERFLKKVS